MKVLDLYCGAGMAADGYVQAGFDVVGWDVRFQPNYPYVCCRWCGVNGIQVGDRFTDEVGEALIDYLKDDVEIVVNKPEETVND